MEFSITSGNPEKQRTDCLVLGVYESRQLSPAAVTVDEACNGYLSTLLRRGDIEGKIGQTLLLAYTPDLPCERILLIGCGNEQDLDEQCYRRILTTAAGAVQLTGSEDTAFYLSELAVKNRETAWKIRTAVTAIEHALYRFDQLKSKKEQQQHALSKIILGVHSRRELSVAEQALQEGAAVAAGSKLARDLGNLPGNICTPSYLAEQARTLAKDLSSLTIKVLEEKDMKTLGMGSLLAVARGSAQAPKFIVIEHLNGPSDQKPIVLVGKGVTFDSGGISLKPGQGMDEMKFDMCGAASVLGTMRACAQLQLPLNIVALIAAVENMPGSKASKPGDIVTSLSGQTIEILNTDAEGRLILCDALTYSRRYKPATVIDIATLTGACVIALGKHPHGLFSNHQPLVDELLSAGHDAVDRAWQMPLWQDYQEQLDSNFADMANIGGREGGAITAACFLARFAEKLHWAHLDIAGTAWNTGKNKGATGRPVPLLTQYLMDRAKETRQLD